MKKLLVIGSTLLLSGCVLGLVPLDVPKIEREIKAWFLESGVEIDYVECPDSMMGKTGDSWRCAAWDPWGFKVDVLVQMTSSDGYVEWRLAP